MSRILSLAGIRLADARPDAFAEDRYTLRTEVLPAGPFISIAFASDGCVHSRSGGCAMCDYGRGKGITSDQMVRAVGDALELVSISPDTQILVSPPGSFLDEREVPAGARREILRLVASKGVSSITIETRFDTVTGEKLDEIRAIVPDGISVFVECGLESASPSILEYSLNKGSDIADAASAIDMITERGFNPIANVLVGSPFLSAAQQIEDAVYTAALFCDRCKIVLFPMHVRQNTAVKILHEEGCYRSPSLWSLVEVLLRLDDRKARSDVTVSWYKVYQQFSRNVVLDTPSDLGIDVVPTTCPSCYSEVIGLLDGFRGGDYHAIDGLRRLRCPCRGLWEDSLVSRDNTTFRQAVSDGYVAILDWLKENNSETQGLLRDDLSSCPLSYSPGF